MNRRRFITSITAIIVFIAALSTSLQAEVRYNVIPIQGPPNCTNGLCSINNNGQIVGFSLTASLVEEAVLFDWTGQGSNIILSPEGRAYSINNNGQIVGSTFNVAGGAALFDSTGEGNNISLGTISGFNSSEAYSISDNGQIVGVAYGSSGRFHACLFDPTGQGNNIDLGTLGGNNSVAVSINDNVQIVGVAYDSSGHWRACLFDQTGQGNNIDLGTLGGNNSVAVSINDNGQIVGCADVNSRRSHACLFDPTGSGNNIDLGPGAAYAINNNGQIVGVDNNNTSILFDPTGHGNNIVLNTLIDTNTGGTFSVSGWWYEVINDNGWIIGEGSPAEACVLIPLPGPNMIPLTMEVQPAGIGINTVIPYPGTTQHTQYTNVALNARNFPLCPDVYLFNHWEGEDIADVNASYTHVLIDEPKTITAVFVLGQRRCGDGCHPILQGDLNKDCYTNFADFAIYVNSWLSCTHPDCD